MSGQRSCSLRRVSGPRASSLALAVCLLLLSACTARGNAAAVLKIGLIAPFEGIGRTLGYEILTACRQAVDEANARDLLDGRRVVLVALNDDLDPDVARAQVRVLAQDSGVIGAVGPFTSETARSAAAEGGAAGVPLLVAAPLADAPAGVASLCPTTEEVAAAVHRRAGCGVACSERAAFYPGDALAAVRELGRLHADGWQGVLVAGPDVLRSWFVGHSGGEGEGVQAAACSLEGAAPAEGMAPEAVLAAAGVRLLLAAVAADIRVHGGPSRAGVSAGLRDASPARGVTWYEVRDGAWRLAP